MSFVYLAYQRKLVSRNCWVHLMQIHRTNFSNSYISRLLSSLSTAFQKELLRKYLHNIWLYKVSSNSKQMHNAVWSKWRFHDYSNFFPCVGTNQGIPSYVVQIAHFTQFENKEKTCFLPLASSLQSKILKLRKSGFDSA